MSWWETMNLDPWGDGEKVLASVATDMSFAQGIAAHRAEVRGKRQRVTVERNGGPEADLCLFVSDAPVEVVEPCS